MGYPRERSFQPGATTALFFVFSPRRLSMGDRVIGALSSCYVNAGNLGIPIAAYVLHDASLVAPALFVRLAPIGQSTLDFRTATPPISACAKSRRRDGLASLAHELARVDPVAGVLSGFVVVLTLIAVGYIAARLGVVPRDSDHLLARVLFYIAMPALLFVTMLDADSKQVFSPLLIGVLLSVGATAALFFAFSPRRLSVSERVVGALSSCYVNAGNLGIPIAAYVLHDASLVAPVLFVQLLVLAPIGLSSLDVLGASGPRSKRTWAASLTNPIVLGALLGLVAGLLPWRIPRIVVEPVSLMGGAAVPLALLLFGVSLCGAFSAGAIRTTKELWLATALKNLAHPAIAYLLGTFVLGLSPTEVFALTVLSALPTAQNIFVYALRYNVAVILARSTILATTVVSIPVLLGIAWLLV